ncbi:8825_t:CDS:2 [Ambispora gerdemannii]|uniref:Lysophospholipase n=1 Tax=Ambispora gerdemannii TaxID=144530 RepID=A0A9N9BS36_9GLOM|nr:8825_t:CDS:2 [Ambispora gerdemannii]
MGTRSIEGPTTGFDLDTNVAATSDTVNDEVKSEPWYKSWLSYPGKLYSDFVTAPTTLSNHKQIALALKKLDDQAKECNKDNKLHPELDWDATVRVSLDLCEDEKNFIRERKEYIRDKFAKYVGVDTNEVEIEDIPTIAFAGSGGGFRAMLATTGYAHAAYDSGILDLATYIAGNGSCWNIASRYTDNVPLNEHPYECLINFYKIRLALPFAHPSSLLKIYEQTKSPETAVELTFGGVAQKRQTGIDCGPIDVFGSLLASSLLLGNDPISQHPDFKLSQQKRFLEGGKNALPIYTALHHCRPWKHILPPEDAALVPNYEELLKEHQKQKDHYLWFEFTPFEVGCDEYPAFIPSWAFGRRFEFGKNVEKIPEQNFGLLVGVFGSAPSAPLASALKQFEYGLPNGWLRDTWKQVYSTSTKRLSDHHKSELESFRTIPQARNYNFAYHLHRPPYELGTTNGPYLDFVDSGASSDLPMYPLTHPNRKIDLIIAVDASTSTIDHKYFDEQQEFICFRRGLTRTPRAGMPNNKYVEVYDYTPNGKERDGHTPAATHDTTLVYMPFLANEKVDKDFIPATSKVCAFNCFTYTPENVDLVTRLAKQNWSEVEEIVKSVIKDAWEKKKIARLNAKK